MKRERLALIIFLWAVLVVLGLGVGLDYGSKPGGAQDFSTYWPADSDLKRSETRFTLLMFVHPKCPCTLASLEEFNRILAHYESIIFSCVIFVNPKDASSDWQKGRLWQKVGGLPSTERLIDDRGVAAQRFGATTSGSVFLYNNLGNLAFCGGITAARGHEGDNLGRLHVESILAGKESRFLSTPVFGCELFSEEQIFSE